MNKWDKDTEMSWCPGCGNFGLKKIVMNAYTELGLAKEQLIMVSGIGQAAKSPQYYDVNYFNGLHGRAMPTALGIHTANPEVKLVVQSGDGDIYGEGGNHFIHAIRRNPDMTLLVHDNMIYGLTKGQAAPTSQKGMVTPIQTEGVFLEPINPVALAIIMGATFVARASVGEAELTKDLVKQAINHKGFALVDIFQSCVSFNKFNTYSWFKKNTNILSTDYDPSNKIKALETALKTDPWPLGLLYKEEGRPVFTDSLAPYKTDKTPLYKRSRPMQVVSNLMKELV